MEKVIALTNRVIWIIFCVK